MRNSPLCRKVNVAGPISQSIAISTLSTAVEKWRKTQKLGIPVFGHAWSALLLVWVQLNRRIGGRPIRLFAGAFPSFFDNPDTDRALDLDGFLVLAPPVFFAECVVSHSKRIPRKPFSWRKFS